MGVIMMDMEQTKRIQIQKDVDDVMYNYNRSNIIEGYYDQVMQERKKQMKLKKIIKIMIVSFVLLTTVMVANLDKLSVLEKKMFYYWSKFPHVIEHPLTIK
tara:strand:+ start:4186 stop:4488 length:303 start_codon:yes stop_codon:yes gene_type:complete